MEQMTQKDIRNLIKSGAAVDLSALPESLDLYRRLEKVGYSFGVYGCNGALFRDIYNGRLYAIPARNSTLFFYL